MGPENSRGTIIYSESFAGGPGPWVTGKDQEDGRWMPNIFGKRGDHDPLGWTPTGGHDGGGYASSESPWYFDDNHGEFMWFHMVISYPAEHWQTDHGSRDLRNAVIELTLRGHHLDLKNAKLYLWVQGGDGRQDGYYVKGGVFHCWALTSQPIDHELRDGEWHTRAIRLDDDEDRWSQMGLIDLKEKIVVIQSRTGARGTLDHILAGHHHNIGFLLGGLDPLDLPTGRIDLSQVTIRAATQP
ncbi:hypothetical protein HQ590_16920 [bacterium]|nr:hypothetical protein [bacterium]